MSVRDAETCRALVRRIVELIDSLRAAANLSPVELADQSGISVATISAILGQRREICADEMELICGVLGVRASDLIRAAEGEAIALG